VRKVGGWPLHEGSCGHWGCGWSGHSHWAGLVIGEGAGTGEQIGGR
jgi:hypothetical protein